MTPAQFRGAEPELLDVVPWNYGFAHAWALRWLVTNQMTRQQMLNLLTGDTPGTWELTAAVAHEHRVRGARADLAVWAARPDGQELKIAVEVKVNDPINARQLAAYQADKFTPVLYVPGLTGMMYAPNGLTEAAERWVTGSELADAVGDVELPRLIGSYVAAVAAEGRRMELARAFSRDEVDDFPVDGQARYEDVMDAGWVAEVALALRRRGATDVIIRPQANDRGLYWRGSQRTTPDGADVYVDVVADLRTHYCSVALKVKGRDTEARLAAYRQVLDAGPPSDEAWTKGRRPSARSGRVWTLNASELNADEAAQRALTAAALIARVVVDPASPSPRRPATGGQQSVAGVERSRLDVRPGG